MTRFPWVIGSIVFAAVLIAYFTFGVRPAFKTPEELVQWEAQHPVRAWLGDPSKFIFAATGALATLIFGYSAYTKSKRDEERQYIEDLFRRGESAGGPLAIRGFEYWLERRRLHRSIVGNERLRDFVGANLEGGVIPYGLRERLAQIDFTRANLARVGFPRQSNLSGSCFVEADLTGANLEMCDLSDSTLIKANLKDAWLGGANLHGADLGDADLECAMLLGVVGLTTDQLFSAKAHGLTALMFPEKVIDSLIRRVKSEHPHFKQSEEWISFIVRRPDMAVRLHNTRDEWKEWVSEQLKIGNPMATKGWMEWYDDAFFCTTCGKASCEEHPLTAND